MGGPDHETKKNRFILWPIRLGPAGPQALRMVREPSPLRARSQGAERGEAPSPREAKRATHCSETS
jgi:hypothetical protein